MSNATICHVLHGLPVGGAEVLAARLARQLREMFRFVFVCLDELGSLGQCLMEEGFIVDVLGRRPGLDWSCARRLSRFLHREHVDLLHAHQYTPFFYSALARLAFRRPAVLFTEHGRWFPDYPRMKRIVANRLLLEQRDCVVGVGESVRSALIRNEGIPAQRVSVIYNGVNLSDFADVSRHERLSVRQELGLGTDDLIIIQVARLDSLKDHGTAIRTLARVVDCRRDVRLLLVGDGPERSAIEEEIRRIGLTSHAHLLGLRTDVARLLAAADLAILTSVSEGIPLTLIEAMAAGLPVVATAVGGVGEVVEEGVTGLLAPSGDDVNLAERILQLADDAGLRERMGQRGCERARAMFSESHMHDQYGAVYHAMLAG